MKCSHNSSTGISFRATTLNTKLSNPILTRLKITHRTHCSTQLITQSLPIPFQIIPRITNKRPLSNDLHLEFPNQSLAIMSAPNAVRPFTRMHISSGTSAKNIRIIVASYVVNQPVAKHSSETRI